MEKLPFEYVSLQVDRLYDKEIDEKDISEHIEFIAAYINSCGYTEQEFFELSTGEKVLDKKSN